jgi:hypothetical protein
MPQPKPGDAARKVIMARADKRAAGLRPTIEALQASGVTSLQGMAAALNEAGIPTPRGKRQWHPGCWRERLCTLTSARVDASSLRTTSRVSTDSPGHMPSTIRFLTL